MISVCVQHHPARGDLLALLEQLGGYEIVVDPDPDSRYRSAFRTYLECLRRTPTDATHRLIVQDDAIPCRGFRDLAEAAIAEHPDELVAFFVPGRSSLRDLMATAHAKGERWLALPNLNWTPTVALCWPAALIAEFLEYAEQVIAPRRQRAPALADDPYVGEWVKGRRSEARRRRQREPLVWATVPCLVQHPDVAQSLFRRDLRPRAGENRARVAALYVDDIGAIA